MTINTSHVTDTFTPSTGVVSIAGSISTSSASIASASTITPTTGNNQYDVTALAVPATIAIPSGTAVDGLKLIIRIKDNGTAQTLSWNATYRIVGTTLPTTTIATKTLYVGCIYNSTVTATWDVIAVAQQA